MTKHYEQRKAANERYLSTQDKIMIRMPKESGIKEAIQSHAEARGESVNAFLLRAAMETMERDNHPPRRHHAIIIKEDLPPFFEEE